MAITNQTASSRFPRPERVADAEHTVIYYDPDYFAGMIFNNNFWAFPDGEILINFTRARCSYKDSYDLWHFVVDGIHGEYVTLRSTDGGKTLATGQPSVSRHSSKHRASGGQWTCA